LESVNAKAQWPQAIPRRQNFRCVGRNRERILRPSRGPRAWTLLSRSGSSPYRASPAQDDALLHPDL